MLTVNVKKGEMFNEFTNEFSYFEGGTLQLEHSLVSIRKWEAKWHISFLETEKLTIPQIKDYIRCMTLNKPKDSKIYDFISSEDIKDVIKYIKDPHTATWFAKGISNGTLKSRREKITAELIYYWMISLNIPTEFEKWHLNQLMTLIRVVSAKSKSPKKRNPKEAAMEIERLNEERKAKWNTRG